MCIKISDQKLDFSKVCILPMVDTVYLTDDCKLHEVCRYINILITSVYMYLLVCDKNRNISKQ